MKRKNLDTFAYMCTTCRRIKVNNKVYRVGDTGYTNIRKEYEGHIFDEQCPTHRSKK